LIFVLLPTTIACITQDQDPVAGGNPAPRTEPAAGPRALDSDSDSDAEEARKIEAILAEDCAARVRAIEAAVVRQADENGGLAGMQIQPWPSHLQNHPLPRLPDPMREAALFRPNEPVPSPMPSPGPTDAETELTGMIAECRFLMREVAFHSARLTPDPAERLHFLSSACGLAQAGAVVGDTLARLRAAGTPAAESRKTLTYEVYHRAAQPNPESGGNP
jgi:hypothetical protein